MKKLFAILMLSLISPASFSQQDPQYSLYMFNPMGVNPGYAGSREVLSAALVHRSQWVGFEGSPTTQAFSVNMPLKNKKMGLGLQIINDKIGPRTTQNITASYAYRLKLGAGKLAFGLRGGILNYNINWDKITYKDQNDLISNTSSANFIIPTFDFGIYYNTPTFYAGVSFDHINQTPFNLVVNDSINSTSRKAPNNTATVGKAFLLNRNLVLKTSALLRLSKSRGNLDLNAGLLLKNKIYVGLSLRSTNAIIILTEINLTKKLKMGFAYDIDRSEIAVSTSGSFEFFLGYDVNLFKSKVASPRYF